MDRAARTRRRQRLRHDGVRPTTCGNATARALEVAKGDQHLDLLTELIAATVEQIAPIVPGLADLALEHEPTQVELDLDVAEDFLDIAPVELQRLGVELIGPERLVRTRVNVAGEATPAPADDRRKQFGNEALVEWKLVIGDDEISDAELARAERSRRNPAAHRPPMGAHRCRRAAPQTRQAHRAQGRPRRVVTPLELLRLANDDELGDDDTPADLDPRRPTTDVTRTTARRPSTPPGSATCSPGCPTSASTKCTSRRTFIGELRHYQRRGLAWMQFLAQLGLGGCLADDMGLGKTATTLAHLARAARAAPRGVPAERRAQLGVRRPPGSRRRCDVVVHHGAERRRGRPTTRCSSSRPRRRRHHDLRSARRATSSPRQRSTGRRSCSTRRR